MLVSLHEDSNRILRKPYIEIKDFNPKNESEEEYFKKCKKEMRQRDKSMITDLFYGICRTQVVCPTCQHQSIKFEDFNMLTLPVSRNERSQVVYVQDLYSILSLNRVAIEYPQDTMAFQVKRKYAKKSGILNSEFLHFYRFNTDTGEMILITDENFELPKLKKEKADVIILMYDVLFEDSIEINPVLKHIKRNNEKLSSRKMSSDSVETITEKSNNKEGIHSENSKITNEIGGEEISAKIEEENPEIVEKEYVSVVIDIAGNKKDDTYGIHKKMYLNKKTAIRQIYNIFYMFIKNGCGPRSKLKSFEDLFDNGTEKSANVISLYLISGKEIKKHSFDKEAVITLKENDRLSLKINDPDVAEQREFTRFTSEDTTFRIKEETQPTIYDCLDTFTKHEVLDKDNEWFCPKCKEHRRAVISVSIQESPKLLIIHLKRFKKHSKYYSKNEILIDFPIQNLEIGKYLSSSSLQKKNTLYDLYAISNHMGDSNGGHYTAYCKNHKTNKWYEYDDRRVRRINPEDCKSASAYVLFYRCQD